MRQPIHPLRPGIALLGTAALGACLNNGAASLGQTETSSSASSSGHSSSTTTSSSSASSSSSSTTTSSSSGGTGGAGGSATSSSTTTSSGGGVCVPEATQPCYDGPVGTSGVGVCKSGTQTCDAAGDAWGPCLGEVTPQAVVCDSGLDDACDGQIDPPCPCTAGATATCYDGPAAAVGKGPCKAGTKTCNAQGTAWSPCAGEVLPKPENCSTAADEDCDGTSPPCSSAGTFVWAKAPAAAGDQQYTAITTDASSNVIAGGTTTASFDAGCGALPPVAGTAALIVKLGPTGTCMWSQAFGANASVGGIAANPQGDVYVTGQFEGTVDFGCGVLTSAGANDVFVAKLSPTGTCVWSERWGDALDQQGLAIAIDPTGNVIVGGTFQGKIDLGNASLTSPGDYAAFVVKLGPAAPYFWSTSFGGSGGPTSVTGVASDGAGNVVVVGSFSGTADFGGGVLTSAGGSDMFVAHFDAASGSASWAYNYGDALDQQGRAIAADAAGNAYVTGDFQGTVTLNGTSYTAVAGGYDALVAKLDATGKRVWSRVGTGSGDQHGSAIAIDGSGRVALAGGFTGSINLGKGAVASDGGSDAYLARFDLTGTPLWVKTFGDASDQAFAALTIDVEGNELAAGVFAGSVDFGSGSKLSAIGQDAVIVKYTP